MDCNAAPRSSALSREDEENLEVVLMKAGMLHLKNNFVQEKVRVLAKARYCFIAIGPFSLHFHSFACTLVAAIKSCCCSPLDQVRSYYTLLL